MHDVAERPGFLDGLCVFMLLGAFSISLTIFFI